MDMTAKFHELKRLPEWEALEPDAMLFIEQRQFPPAKYIADLAEFERTHAGLLRRVARKFRSK
jgi:hypothetical protein